MPALRKYPLELMERGARMVLEARQKSGKSRGAVARVAKRLGAHPEALWHYVRRAEIDAGHWAGTTSSDAARIAELERENRELRRGECDLALGSAFFAELDRPHSR
jgi:transposase